MLLTPNFGLARLFCVKRKRAAVEATLQKVCFESRDLKTDTHLINMGILSLKRHLTVSQCYTLYYLAIGSKIEKWVFGSNPYIHIHEKKN